MQYHWVSLYGWPVVRSAQNLHWKICSFVFQISNCKGTTRKILWHLFLGRNNKQPPGSQTVQFWRNEQDNLWHRDHQGKMVPGGPPILWQTNSKWFSLKSFSLDYRTRKVGISSCAGLKGSILFSTPNWFEVSYGLFRTILLSLYPINHVVAGEVCSNRLRSFSKETKCAMLVPCASFNSRGRKHDTGAFIFSREKCDLSVCVCLWCVTQSDPPPPQSGNLLGGPDLTSKTFQFC